MTINLSDIKMQQPQRLTDNDDGGGQMIAAEVVSGQIDNLFDRITRIDRAGGNVSLRQPYMHVDTTDTQVLGSAHVIVQRPPADERVSIVLFDTGENPDERANAANYISNYLTKGPVSNLRLWDTQTQGSRQILCFTDVGTALPVIGDVLCISVEGSGYPAHQQFLRISQIASATQTFTLGQNNTITWLIVTITFGGPLDQDYVGADPQASSYPTVATLVTKVRTTQVSDAATYYGIAPVSGVTSAGDNVLHVSSVYAQLVPSTESELGFANQTALADSLTCIPAGPEISFGYQADYTGDRFLGSPIAPGSLKNVSAYSADPAGDSNVRHDDGQGNLVDSSGQITGSVIYSSGRVSSTSGWTHGTFAGKFTPAAAVVTPNQTLIDQITAATQRFTYTQTLRPLPAPGSVSVSYRALGKWYTLRDNGSGQLKPDIANTGGGNVYYDTGAVTVSFASLPDAGSCVIWSWGQVELFAQRTGDHAFEPPHVPISLGAQIAPTSFVITWTNGVSKTATTSSSGVISGDAVGYINPATGEGYFTPNAIPASSTTYHIACNTVASYTESGAQSADGSGDLHISLGHSPVQPGTVIALVPLTSSGGSTILGSPFQVHDDGSGHMFDSVGNQVGTINYSTGAVVIHPAAITVEIYNQTYSGYAGAA